MFEYDLILRDDEYEVPVTLHITEEVDIVEAGFIAVDMFCAIDSRMSIES